jgi:hypothetical protein
VNEIHDAKRGTDPAYDDSALLALEQQFNEITAKLLPFERADKRFAKHSVRRSPSQYADQPDTWHELAARTDVEAILARLYPIELAIMQTPAHTIAGLGVKARHAAHVTSQYWDAPLDRIDWDARVVRLLIEAVCDFVRTPAPFETK